MFTSLGIIALAICYNAFGQNTTTSSGNTTSSSNSSILSFGPINFAGYNNYVYRDEITSAQVLLSDTSSATSPRRFIAAFPNGNTGVLVYFVPVSSGSGSNATLGASLVEGSLASYTGDYNQTGLEGQMSISADLTFGVTLIGSVRTLRDYVEGGGVTNSIFNYTLGDYNQSSVQLVRNWINGTTVQYLTFDVQSGGSFDVQPSSNVTIPPNITLSLDNPGTNATVRFSTSFNFTGTTPETPYVPLEGLNRGELFRQPDDVNGTSPLGQTLSAIIGPGANISDQVSFLSYSDKSLAGGWRFLTYFGRDTLLALRLLLPVISDTAAEAILGAVLERVNETGTICHEETIGDYASYVNIQNNQSGLGNTPVYNYVMLDTDFLLLPTLADYFLNTPQGSNRSTEFLARSSSLKNGTFEALLLENVNHVLNLSRPFAEDPKRENLVPIRDPVVGNWRDSSSGLGYGIYPFDVETALIPAALRAIASLAEANIIPSNYTNATAYAETWETEASTFFEINITSAEAETRLENYVQQANLSTSLLYGAGSLNASEASGNSSYGSDNASQIIGGGNDSSVFYALSLKSDFTPVEVLNSDLGFVLLYGNNISESIVRATVQALQPYPRGLLTNVGVVVANAAYDSNTTNIEVFSNIQYHGAVSWSWQQALFASGISKQLGLCGLSSSTQLLPSPVTETQPSWCNNTQLTQQLQEAQSRLWLSIRGSASALFTEVLSPIWDEEEGVFTIGDLGAISPTGTEGDAIQLWSYGFLAEVDPLSGVPVAAGFPYTSNSTTTGNSTTTQ